MLGGATILQRAQVLFWVTHPAPRSECKRGGGGRSLPVSELGPVVSHCIHGQKPQGEMSSSFVRPSSRLLADPLQNILSLEDRISGRQKKKTLDASASARGRICFHSGDEMSSDREKTRAYIRQHHINSTSVVMTRVGDAVTDSSPSQHRLTPGRRGENLAVSLLAGLTPQAGMQCPRRNIFSIFVCTLFKFRSLSLPFF